MVRKKYPWHKQISIGYNTSLNIIYLVKDFERFPDTTYICYITVQNSKLGNVATDLKLLI